MVNIIDKTKCCGCTACANVCPVSAIHMKPDEEGFLYPIVNTELCVHCGICHRACPIENKPQRSQDTLTSWVLRTKSKNILEGSTSGGFVSPLFEWVLEQKGVICAATYDKNFQIVHTFVHWNSDSIPESMAKIRGSKYVQSYLGNCYASIRNYLTQGRMVCFVGTTCQVNGLKAFLGNEYDNLICIDLVCHGTPSPKLWGKYLDYQRTTNGEIGAISFRHKTYGYHSGTMRIQFLNGKTYFGSSRVDLMLKSFFSEISSRPICYRCPFKELNRCSDFTIYDCWHASQLVPGLKDDDQGYTNVIVQSPKGSSILEQIQEDYECYPVETDQAVKLDGVMVLHSATPHRKRDEFYKELDTTPLVDHIQKFIPITMKDRLIERSKHMIYRLGIYAYLKRVLKR